MINRHTSRAYPGALALAFALTTQAAAGTEAVAISTAPVDLLAPPGRFHHVNGIRLYMHCVGEGSPTVVIDAGIGASSLEWTGVQQALAPTTRVCAWDRPGYGWSDPGPSPRSTPQVAEELTQLLTEAGVAAPWVLVGHSFGGFTARYLAARYPEQVAGLILVESSTPVTEVGIAPAPAGTGRHNPLVEMDDAATWGVPDSLQAQASYLNTRRKAIFAQMDELRHFHESSVAVLEAGPLPPLPLIVLTRGERAWPAGAEGDAAEAAWAQAQAELASLSPDGELRVIAGAGHSPHTETPEQVAGAIREVVARVRRPQPVEGAAGTRPLQEVRNTGS
jgi:pimeloyl-ACP methyl ester carboxylesterase